MRYGSRVRSGLSDVLATGASTFPLSEPRAM